MILRLPGMAVLLLGFAVVLPAQEPPPETLKPKFPETGALLPGPFHVLNLTGERKGRYHCLVCRNGGNPVAAIFIRPRVDEANKERPLDEWLKKMEADQPLANLIKRIDAITAQNQDVHMGSFVVFMVKDKLQEPIWVKSQTLPKETGIRPTVLSVMDEKGPEEWNIDPTAEVLVVLYSRHKVAATFAFNNEKALDDKEVENVVKAYEKIIPPYAKKFDKGKIRGPGK